MYENWIVSLHSSLYRRKTDHSSVTRSPRVVAVDYLRSQLWMSYRIRHACEMLGRVEESHNHTVFGWRQSAVIYCLISKPNRKLPRYKKSCSLPGPLRSPRVTSASPIYYAIDLNDARLSVMLIHLTIRSSLPRYVIQLPNDLFNFQGCAQQNASYAATRCRSASTA